MPIPTQYAHRFVYHFSHIDNLPGLLRHGFLAKNRADLPRRHRSIAAAGIQERRATMRVPCGPGGCVHDYVPCYFGSLSPMLLGVVNKKNVDQYQILYFEFPIEIAGRADVIFTDASANTLAPPSFYEDPAHLSELDWAAIDSLKWGGDDDFRHRRMAELLVHGNLAVTAASRCVVWNDEIKNQVERIVDRRPFPPIEFEDCSRRHWFKDFKNDRTCSLVKGPGEIAFIFEQACEYVQKRGCKNAATAEFANLRRLLEGLRADFACLPQTAELVGLKSDNSVHRETVDVHTKEVVAKLQSLPDFTDLEDRSKRIVELAAFLHDIGKGPRSRWADNGGVQQVDPNHPVGAMPMVAEVFTERVANVTPASARTLMKLVCYHDLVGDVLGKGRDRQQIVDVVDNQEELDMLFALCRADATVLGFEWNKAEARQLYNYCLEAIERNEKRITHD